jgi:hypothetical protein
VGVGMAAPLLHSVTEPLTHTPERV